MKNYLTLIINYSIILLISSSLVSCKADRYLYSSLVPNSPILEGKGDASLGVHISGAAEKAMDKKRWGYDIQTAYALTNNVAFTYSFSTRNEHDIYTNFYTNFFDSSNVKYVHTNHEFGIGYFQNPSEEQFNKHRKNNLGYWAYVPPILYYSIFRDAKVGFSIYGGYGFGKTSFIDNGLIKPTTLYSRLFDDTYTKFFIQPAVHFYKSKYFSFSFILKLSDIKFTTLNTNYTPNEQEFFKVNKLVDANVTVNELFTNVTYKIPKLDWLMMQLNCGTAWTLNKNYKVRDNLCSLSISINPIKLLKINSK